MKCSEKTSAASTLAYPDPKRLRWLRATWGQSLFMDEFCSLVERHHDRAPDMIGMETVNQLPMLLEEHRLDFCFMGAGYQNLVDEFLAVKPGLASRFNRRFLLPTYSGDEIVEITNVMHNGRFARNVLEAAKQPRDSRVVALNRAGEKPTRGPSALAGIAW